MNIQVLQIIGAVLILVAFILLQLRRLNSHSILYLVLNVVGAALLTFTAIIEHQVGFIILEAVWALTAFASLVRTFSKR